MMTKAGSQIKVIGADDILSLGAEARMSAPTTARADIR
jgi:hypothetical protein